MTDDIVLGYARVSTKTQELAVQKDLITKYCAKEGLNLLDIIEDKMSGRKMSRPGWDLIMENVRNHKIDGVVFVRADRIARSTQNLLKIVEEFVTHKRKLISIDDPIFKDLESPQGQLVLTVMGAVAEFEINMFQARVKEGKELAEIIGTKSGKPMHRPEKIIDWNKFDELYNMGVPKRKIAETFNISESKLYKAIKLRSSN